MNLKSAVAIAALATLATIYRVGCDCGSSTPVPPGGGLDGALVDAGSGDGGGSDVADAGSGDSGNADGGPTGDAGFYYCGSGSCDGGETCSSCAVDCGPCAGCNGTLGQWSGCRGDGCYVCVEFVTGYTHYFVNHPACLPNSACAGSYFTCNASCPAPASADL